MTLSMSGFSLTNRLRCEHPKGFNHPLDSWSMAEWFLALTGELGEAANIGKKLNRLRDGLRGNDPGETKEVLQAAFAEELADIYIYLDLLAQSQEVDLAAAVRAKFNRTSQKLGCPITV